MVPLNHWLVVQAFTQVYLWFLCVLVLFDPYSSLKWFHLYIHIPIVGCLLSYQCVNLFSKVIVLFLLILRIIKCIFLLFSIIIILCLFGKIYHTSGSLCNLGWPWSLGFWFHLLNPYCSFANAKILGFFFKSLKELCGLYICYYVKMTSWEMIKKSG